MNYKRHRNLSVRTTDQLLSDEVRVYISGFESGSWRRRFDKYFTASRRSGDVYERYVVTEKFYSVRWYNAADTYEEQVREVTELKTDPEAAAALMKLILLGGLKDE